MLCDRPMAADIAITSRLRSESSIPSCPCVTPSHIAGTPPATWPTALALVQRFADDLRVVFIGLVSGQHVVVGGDDGNVVAQHALQGGFVVSLAGRESVSQIAAGQLRTMHGVGFGLVQSLRGKPRGCHATVR